MDLRKAINSIENSPLELFKAKFYIDESGNDYNASDMEKVKTIDRFTSKKYKQVFSVLGNEQTNDYWMDVMVYIDYDYYKDPNQEYEIVGEKDVAGGYFLGNEYNDELRTRNAVKSLSVKTDKDNLDLYEMWQIFGVGANMTFEDFVSFIKELISISSVKADLIDGEKNFYNSNNAMITKMRKDFFKYANIDECKVTTSIKRSGIIYFCDKRKKKEYFKIVYPINGRVNQYSSFAELVNAVHDEYLVQKGLKKRVKQEAKIVDEYKIID